MMATPFDPADAVAYATWRERKLSGGSPALADLLVEVNDPAALSAAERAALLARCARHNLALYRCARHGADKSLPARLGAQFGLQRLDANWLADEDGVSQIRVKPEAGGGTFIPYTTRPIKWHTDGYYHPPDRNIRAMVLHCVRPAVRGGENALIDHELAYIALRDANPAWAFALMRHDAMSIPARMDEDGVARPEQSGPVFSVIDGTLHMRYTARTHSIAWHSDPQVAEAVQFLVRWLAAPATPVIRVLMEAGMGVICNNVLHDRAGFEDDPAQPRLLYRARFLDRIASGGENSP